MKKVTSILLAFLLLFSAVPAAFASNPYTVKTGDSLWGIAKKFNTTWQRLAEINKLKNPRLIFPNQALQVETDKTAAIPEIKADYVVVGGGAAGLMSALELSSKGSVILLEKMPALGGTTIRSKGYLWSVDSSINKSTGKGLSGPDLLKYYKDKVGTGYFNEALLQNMINVSGSTIDRLVELGIPFNTTLVPGTPNYPALLCLTVNGEGPVLVSKFRELVLERKVNIMLDTRATELILENGAVKGVKATNNDKQINILAQKTILATGGFVRSEGLMASYNKEFIDNVRFSGVGSTGDGILMAMDADAQLVGDGVLGIWGMNEAYGYVGDVGSLVRQTAVYINKSGNRFVNEKRYYAEVHKELNIIQDKLAYGLFDSSNKTLVPNLEKALAEGLAVKANTIEELAKALKVDAANLKNTIDKYNVAKAAGKDGEFGISNAAMTPILQAPFYSVEVRPTLIGTIKGLKVSTNAEVLNSKNTPIPNLFAVGELIIGNFINNEYPTTGTVVATSIYSGKIAAEKASVGVSSKYTAPSVESAIASLAKKEAANQVTTTKYKDGTYTGESKGMFGLIKVEVNVKNGVINTVKVLSHSDTPGISDTAIQRIPANIAKANTPDVDIVTGASYSSKGIIGAVKVALEKAK